MRSVMIALVLAAGFGLAGTSSTIAAPTSGKVLGDIARSESLTQDVRRRCHVRCRHGYYSRRHCRRYCHWW